MLKLLGRRKTRAARADDVPPSFGTPVADSLQQLGEEMLDSAARIRKYEPLPLDIMRDYGLPLVAAGRAEMDAFGALCRALGRK
jgi:hypothetical protein